MKRTILVVGAMAIIILIVVLLSGKLQIANLLNKDGNATPAARTENTEWETFNDEKVGISYQYPAAWELRQPDGSWLVPRFVFTTHSGKQATFTLSASQSLPDVGEGIAYKTSNATWTETQVRGSGLDTFLYWLFHTDDLLNKEKILQAHLYIATNDVSVDTDYTPEFQKELVLVKQILASIAVNR